MRAPFIALLLASIALATFTNNARSAALAFNDMMSFGRVSDPQISPDGKTVVFVVTHYSLTTNKGDSDLFSVPINGGEVRQLTRRPGSDSQPRFSPDGSMIAFASSRSGESQIWVLPTHGGEARQVTDLSTGASNPLWTPDGKSIVFRSRVYSDCSDDDCNRKRIKAEEDSKVKARVIDNLLYVHWDSWDDGRTGRVFVVPAEGGAETPFVPDIDTGDGVPAAELEVPTIALGSGSDVAIAPDGSEICVAANSNRNAAVSINNDLFIFSAAGGAWKRITSNPANDNHPVYSPDGRYIAYRAMSRPGTESDRYRLKLYDRQSGETLDLGELADRFDRSVGSIAWAPDSRKLYVTADDLGYNSLFEIRAEDGKVKQLTTNIYVTSVVVSADGKKLVYLQQTSRQPNEVFVANSSGRGGKKISNINDEILAGIEMNDLEPFWFGGAGGDKVHGWILKPPGFESGKKYPVVFLVHGGPQGAWHDSISYRWNYQMFASPGYVVIAINPRGSTGFGQKFTDEISRDWGGKVYEDLMRGLDYALANFDYVDENRIAAAGASYGGYMMNWFEGHTDRFKCLVNHDGVYNLESFYGTTEELWFPEREFGGTPWDAPDDYIKFSPHNYVNDFKTPMLVVQGGKDFRVPIGESMQIFTALQRKGIPSRLLWFPEQGHWVNKPLNAELWWKTVLDWIGGYIGGQ